VTQLYALFSVFVCPVSADSWGFSRSPEQGFLKDVDMKIYKLGQREDLCRAVKAANSAGPHRAKFDVLFVIVFFVILLACEGMLSCEMKQ
jgi:hypothetical protein